ncbi:hypothetical protein [Pedobacter frigiditerrae]|uniref:hypothetical protein n=1 Tax=Pedobacter frigiditerrae TaxID=2530452 RepID=UPI0029303D48|nr:hypothetical protein [Pedobacter frigiditerrae]
MKNYFSKLVLLFILTATAGLTSCKKSDSEPSNANDTKLIKVSTWNPSTGAEVIIYELVYDAKGIVSSVRGGNNDLYTPEYNSDGKLSKVTKSNPNGRQTIYTLTYNAAGQVIKNNQASTSSGAVTGNTEIVYDYNANGKISKETMTYATGSTVQEYTWNGENLSETKSTYSSTSIYTSKYVSYDDKLSPYLLGGQIVSFVLGGVAQSKNNVTEIQTTSGTTNNSQKRTYEYNAAGYATSMKLMDGSNEGQKFYYNK